MPSGANGLNLAPVYLALATEGQREEGIAQGLSAITDSIIKKQEADGSWAVFAGRPPIFDSNEVMTRWTYLALSANIGNVRDDGSSPALSRQKAAEWLNQAPADGGYQAQLLRLLFRLREGQSPESVKGDVDGVLARQNPDGGWSQTSDMASDAYATGLALYVLMQARLVRDRPEIQRAVEFLVEAQTDDGSWPMLSRPMPTGGRAATPEWYWPEQALLPLTHSDAVQRL